MKTTIPEPYSHPAVAKRLKNILGQLPITVTGTKQTAYIHLGSQSASLQRVSRGWYVLNEFPDCSLLRDDPTCRSRKNSASAAMNLRHLLLSLALDEAMGPYVPYSRAVIRWLDKAYRFKSKPEDIPHIVNALRNIQGKITEAADRLTFLLHEPQQGLSRHCAEAQIRHEPFQLKGIPAFFLRLGKDTSLKIAYPPSEMGESSQLSLLYSTSLSSLNTLVLKIAEDYHVEIHQKVAFGSPWGDNGKPSVTAKMDPRFQLYSKYPMRPFTVEEYDHLLKAHDLWIHTKNLLKRYTRPHVKLEPVEHLEAMQVDIALA